MPAKLKRECKCTPFLCYIEKIKAPHNCDAVLSDINKKLKKLSSFNLAGTKAAGAYGNGSIAAVYNSLNLSYVGLPNSVGLSVGMGNVVTESNALSTYGTLCHLLHLQIKCYKNSNTL